MINSGESLYLIVVVQTHFLPLPDEVILQYNIVLLPWLHCSGFYGVLFLLFVSGTCPVSIDMDEVMLGKQLTARNSVNH